MKVFALSAAVGAVLLGLITPTLTAPTARSARGFRLIMTRPSQQTFAPQYLTCAGTVTSSRPAAALYYFSDTPPFGQLTCQDDTAVGAVGWARGSDGGLFAPFPGPKEDGVFTKFSVAEEGGLLAFDSKELGEAEWIARYREGRDIVQAYFGGVTTLDYEVVTLAADFGTEE